MAASSPDVARLQRVTEAVAAWTRQLIDLGGRNTLLHFRDLKQGTLDLGPGSGADAEAVQKLLGGGTVRLSSIFGGPSLFTPDAGSGITPAQAAKRTRVIRAKAQENFEERGLETLLLGYGMASWENTRGSTTPAAPIVLRALQLNPRGSAAEDFDMACVDDFEVNPALIHRLSVEFGVSVDSNELVELLDPESPEPDLEPVLRALSDAAAEVPGFVISDRVVVGNFSYAKLPMVKDLESSVDLLAAHDLIAAIAGDEDARATLRERQIPVDIGLPDHVPVADEYLVLDADASQNYAINAVLAGADLVIEGPPGTGKSQTIANLISTLVARGSRVLFVAEKRAAIDAVLKRLTSAGLADLVLDLHSGGSNKRKFAQGLAASLDRVGRHPLPDYSSDQRALSRRREALAAFASALHEVRAPWGISVYEAQAELCGIPEISRTELRLERRVLEELSAPEFTEMCASLHELVDLRGFDLEAGDGAWSSTYRAGTVGTEDAAQDLLQLLHRIGRESLPDARRQMELIGVSTGAIAVAETPLRSWGDLLALFDSIEQTLRVCTPAVYGLPLEDLSEALEPAELGGLRRATAVVVDAKYRRARKLVRDVLRDGSLKSSGLLDVCRTAKSQGESWAAMGGTGEPLVPKNLASAHQTYEDLCTGISQLMRSLGRDDLASHTATELDRRLGELLAELPVLFRLPTLHRLKSRLQVAGTERLVGEIQGGRLPADRAVSALRHAWLSSIVEAVSVSDSRIGAFDGAAQAAAVDEYRLLDKKHIAGNPARILRAWAEATTAARDAYPTESQLLERQAHLRRGHLSRRELFRRTPNVVGALKPCWAMSPLLVAQLLPPGQYFDAVIFDEASQVTPSDAVSSLLRARRAVVAGDANQLPPTTFFLAATSEEEFAQEELADEDLLALTANLESIMDVMTALLPRPRGTRTLGWHYRSQDERLIAFSNAHIYDWSLTTFPGTSGPTCISHELVDFREGRPGQESSVDDEAAYVVELILEHARLRPNESLGVISMGIKHADRITELLRRRRLDSPELGEFFEERREEPFFIKNLERVQGDERDAIILTIGYGKTADGRMLYRFGPVNQQGGERRLNVAVTRAKRRTTLVSSFSSGDMDPNKLRSEGARLLRLYLQYAESGGSSLGEAAMAKPVLNPFERDVRDALANAGVPVVPQYGVSGYFIDFAAQHPERPGEMVLAIECDGASYHSIPTARDRDRLRQEHLERLGWTFHRIWSTEWFRSREQEINKAVDAYLQAVLAADDRRRNPEPRPDQDDCSSGVCASDPLLPARERGPRPLVSRGARIGDYSRAELVSMVEWIESDTLLRTEDQLLGELMEELGFKVRGRRIVEGLTEAIRAVRTRRTLVSAQSTPGSSTPPSVTDPATAVEKEGPSVVEELTVGDRVRHSSFGEGVVRAVEARGVVRVFFLDAAEEKKLLVNYAPMHKL